MHTRGKGSSFPVANFGGEVCRRRSFCTHAIEHERKRNTGQKEEDWCGKTAKKLAEPKPFAAAIFGTHPGIENMSLKHEQYGEPAHPVQIR